MMIVQRKKLSSLSPKMSKTIEKTLLEVEKQNRTEKKNYYYSEVPQTGTMEPDNSPALHFFNSNFLSDRGWTWRMPAFRTARPFQPLSTSLRAVPAISFAPIGSRTLKTISQGGWDLQKLFIVFTWQSLWMYVKTKMAEPFDVKLYLLTRENEHFHEMSLCL